MRLDICQIIFLSSRYSNRLLIIDGKVQIVQKFMPTYVKFDVMIILCAVQINFTTLLRELITFNFDYPSRTNGKA